MITLYHNPRCSKSREALALTERFAASRGLPLEVVEYLKTPPTLAQLQELLRQLGTDVREMVRSNEEEYAALHLEEADETALLQAIVTHPKLLQRPIAVYQGKAMVGRPPERLGELLR
jgi:arsenate reductase